VSVPLTRVVILGGGLSGLAVAYGLSRRPGFDVTVVEAAPKVGGLAGSFEEDGHRYPLGYHHILHRDRTLLFFLRQIGAMDRVRWRRIRLLHEHGGRLHALGTVRGFLGFPLSAADKLRFAWLMLRAATKRDWREWHGRTAEDLVTAWSSAAVTERLFEPLCRLRFELPPAQVSGAWLGTRLYFREGSAPLGYIPGDNWTSVLCSGMDALVTASGVRLVTNARIAALESRERRIVCATTESGTRIEGDLFVSTLPPESYLRLVGGDDTPGLGGIAYSAMISALCASKDAPPQDFYWLNVASMSKAACGVFVLNNLNPTIGGPGGHCINFVTHLRTRKSPFYLLPDRLVIDSYMRDFRELFGIELQATWWKINRIPLYAPICTPDYENPPIRSRSYENVRFAGTYRAYPSVMSTGVALGSGLATADEMLGTTGSGASLARAARR